MITIGRAAWNCANMAEFKSQHFDNQPSYTWKTASKGFSCKGMAQKHENVFLLALDWTGPKPLIHDLCSVVRGLLWNPTGARTRGYPRHD